MPFQILGIWLRGLLAIGLLAAGGWLLRDWYDRLPTTVVVEHVDDGPDLAVDRRLLSPVERIRAWQPGWDWQTATLAGAGFLLLWPLGGGLLVARMIWSNEAADRRKRHGEAKRVSRPDGSQIHLDIAGPADAPLLILTHGWGMDGTQWNRLRDAVGEQYCIVTWDLPGLGRSGRPSNGDYSLEKYAHDLEAVRAAVGNDRPVVLIGHSIGGMILMTYCRLFPEVVGRQVTGLVVADSTYMNPVRTTQFAMLYTLLEKPVIVPLLYLTIWFSPVVWVMNWLVYLDGSAHSASRRQSFAGRQPAGEVDYTARFTVMDSPAVLAWGMLGMLQYDARETMPTISAPTLVVSSDQDGVTLPEAQDTMCASIPEARMLLLKPARHQALLEHPELFAERVTEFCDSCLKTPVGSV